MLLSVPSSISSEPEDGPRLSLAKKPMPKPDRELKEGKSDEDVSTKSEGFFLLLETADCKGCPLSSEGQSYLRDLKFCLRVREVFNAATFLGLWTPAALFCSWIYFSQLLSCSVQSPEIWGWEAGSSSPWGRWHQQTVVFPPGAFKIKMFPVVQAAEGWLLEALGFGNFGPDALLNVLDDTMLTTISVCRLACDFMSWLTSNHLVLRPVGRHFSSFWATTENTIASSTKDKISPHNNFEKLYCSQVPKHVPRCKMMGPQERRCLVSLLGSRQLNLPVME